MDELQLAPNALGSSPRGRQTMSVFHVDRATKDSTQLRRCITISTVVFGNVMQAGVVDGAHEAKGKGPVATYIVLARFTQQGIENMKDAPQRRAAAKELARSLGGEIKQSYLTTGQYDLLFVTEFPNEEAVARMTLRMAMQGNLRTETMLAFDGETVDRMAATL